MAQPVARSPPSCLPLPAPLPKLTLTDIAGGRRTASLIRSSLGSGLRAAMACTMVGLFSIYGPSSLRCHLTYTAFSYVVTTLLVAGGAGAGDAAAGVASALYATLIGAVPTILAMLVLHPISFSAANTAAAVALSAVVVAVAPADATAKRIALGQVVIVYVASYGADGESRTQAIWRSAHVIACTVLGAAAALLAVLLPFPKLTSHEVAEKSREYVEVAAERMTAMVEAFAAESTACTASSLAQARCVGTASGKLLADIAAKQTNLKWERPLRALLPPRGSAGAGATMTAAKLQSLDIAMRGMEVALMSSPPKAPFAGSPFAADLFHLKNEIALSLLLPSAVATASGHCRNSVVSDQAFDAITGDCKDTASLFFLFCMKLLRDGPVPVESPPPPPPVITGARFWFLDCYRERLVAAAKSAAALGLAVLLGVLFSKESGYWAGLTVAVAMLPEPETTPLNLASQRAMGTAIGSVYGVLGTALVSSQLMEFRFLLLLPWTVLTTGFLRRSRIFGPAGSLTAVLSALIVVGRKYADNPMHFAVERLTETYIGIACLVAAEVVFQPARPAALARAQLARCLGAAGSSSAREEAERLKKLAGDAAAEPRLWFTLFPVTTYQKLHASMECFADMAYFLSQAAAHAGEMFPAAEVAWFEEVVAAALSRLQEVTGVTSLAKLEKAMPKGSDGGDNDPEVGAPRHWAVVSAGEEETEKAVRGFLEHAAAAKGELAVCIGAAAFCMAGMARECRNLEMAVVELLQSENPGEHIDLQEISTKIKSSSLASAAAQSPGTTVPPTSS